MHPPADLVRIDVRYTQFGEDGVPTGAAIQAERASGEHFAFEVNEDVHETVLTWRKAVMRHSTR